YGSNQALSPLYNTSGLVGYWNFDEGSGTIAKDTSGNGRNGTLTNGPVWTSGKVGGALSFDGSNDAVNTSGNSPSLAGNFTISIWTRWNQFQNYGGIVFNYTGGTAPYFNFFLSSYPSTIGFNLSNGVTIQNLSQSYASVNIATNNWYLLDVVVDGSFVRFYVNGTLAQSAPQTVSSIGGSFPFSISHSVNPFNGSLDDARIYNRALSASEISALYNATK
ncbi:MAG: LamG domain-containing protein, partial [Candidatus Paceibacterota bacterium]